MQKGAGRRPGEFAEIPDQMRLVRKIVVIGDIGQIPRALSYQLIARGLKAPDPAQYFGRVSRMAENHSFKGFDVYSAHAAKSRDILICFHKIAHEFGLVQIMIAPQF